MTYDSEMNLLSSTSSKSNKQKKTLVVENQPEAKKKTMTTMNVGNNKRNDCCVIDLKADQVNVCFWNDDPMKPSEKRRWVFAYMRDVKTGSTAIGVAIWMSQKQFNGYNKPNKGKFVPFNAKKCQERALLRLRFAAVLRLILPGCSDRVQVEFAIRRAMRNRCVKGEGRHCAELTLPAPTKTAPTGCCNTLATSSSSASSESASSMQDLKEVTNRIGEGQPGSSSASILKKKHRNMAPALPYNLCISTKSCLHAMRIQWSMTVRHMYKQMMEAEQVAKTKMTEAAKSKQTTTTTTTSSNKSKPFNRNAPDLTNSRLFARTHWQCGPLLITEQTAKYLKGANGTDFVGDMVNNNRKVINQVYV